MYKTICLILLALSTQICNATIINVPSEQPTIQAGIDAASEGDTVLVADGTYAGSGNYNINFNGKNITVMSNGDPNNTIIDCQGLACGFIISSGESTAILKGFTIQNGTAVTDRSLTGGGIYIGNATPTIDSCIFKNNYSGHQGGAIGCFNGNPSFNYCLFIENTATYGAAIYFNSASGNFQDCTFFKNHATEAGAGFYGNLTSTVISNCIISYSTAGEAIVGDATLNCTNIYGNAGGDWTGGIAGQLGTNGNISLDPIFCDTANNNFFLDIYSPCLPIFSDCGIIGALDVGCFTGANLPMPYLISYGLESEADTVFVEIPVIFWSYYDTATSSQSAFEIEVGIDNDWSIAEMWGSGQIISSDTSSIYAGLPLSNHEHYYLRIRVSDGRGWGSWIEDEFYVQYYFIIGIPGDKPTIQDGINFAWNRDTLLVASGTYYEHIDFNGKSITVKGTEGAENTILSKAYDGISLVTFESEEDTLSILDGFTIQNAVDEPAILISTSSSATIKNCIIKNNPNGSISCSGTHLKMISNLFQTNIGDNSFGDFTTIDSNTFINNIGHNGFGTNSIITNNEFANGNGFQIAASGSNIIIQNNEIHNCEGQIAINFGPASDCIFNNNLIYENDGRVDINSGANNVCSNNTIFKNTLTATNIGTFKFTDIDNSCVKNNIVVNNAGYGIQTTNSPNLIIDYNDVYNNNAGNYYGFIPGANDISENPQFCDTTALDFTLAATSPCIGTGEGGANMGALGIGCDAPSPEMPEILNLSIENIGDSLHITNHSPTFMWQYYDQQDRPHTKSEIEVGTDDEWSLAEMWQPSTIETDDTSIIYAGDELLDGETYYVRVRVYNDTLWSNWLVAPFRMNSIPSAPLLFAPDSGLIVSTSRPILVTNNTSDSESDELRYNFEIYYDSALSQLAAYAFNITEGSSQTGWTSDSLTDENGDYWWRARASDGYENGLWSDTWMFILNAFNNPPDPFDLLSPANEEAVSDLSPTFTWNAANDPDPEFDLTYTLYIGLDSLFNFYSQIPDISSETHTLSTDLTAGSPYWWKVKVEDEYGDTSMCNSVFKFWTMACGDANNDKTVNISDAVYIINYVFIGGNPPVPPEAGDANCDGTCNVSDAVWIINYVFVGGNEPCDTSGDGIPDC